MKMIHKYRIKDYATSALGRLEKHADNNQFNAKLWKPVMKISV